MLQLRLLYLFVLVLLTGSCLSRHTQDDDSVSEGNSNAKRFVIERKDGYSILRILNPWQGAENIVYTSFLVRRGDPVPDKIDSSKVIFIPVRSIICMSTTYLPMISALGEVSTIKGISGSGFIYDEVLRKRIDRGEVFDVGYEDNINKELLIHISPDLVMSYGIGSESTGYLNKLRELGFKIIYNAEYLEDDPLGKAEWIKVFGILFDKENEAEKIFEEIEESYSGLRNFISNNTVNRPKVMLGLPWKDTWFISPGNSYISRLITDAGGDYLWKDINSEVSMPYGIENVYMKAVDTDFWLNIGAVESRNAIITVDPRLGELPPFTKGNLYNNNNRISEDGGNDYWESGTLRPQIILADLASIFHPELFPDHKLYYYKRIN